jgi:hypothetical protein
MNLDERKLISVYAMSGWHSYHHECYRGGSHDVAWERWPEWGPKLIHHITVNSARIEVPDTDVLCLWQEADRFLASWNNMMWEFLGPKPHEEGQLTGHQGMYLAALEPAEDIIQVWDRYHGGRMSISWSSIAYAYKMFAEYEAGVGATQLIEKHKTSS